MEKVQLSLEEWQRLAEVTPEERESALKLLRRCLAEQWKFEANIREMGYEIARKAVKGHPDLEAYLDAMYKLDNYYGIASLLNTRRPQRQRQQLRRHEQGFCVPIAQVHPTAQRCRRCW